MSEWTGPHADTKTTCTTAYGPHTQNPIGSKWPPRSQWTQTPNISNQPPWWEQEPHHQTAAIVWHTVQNQLHAQTIISNIMCTCTSLSSKSRTHKDSSTSTQMDSYGPTHLMSLLTWTQASSTGLPIGVLSTSLLIQLMVHCCLRFSTRLRFIENKISHNHWQTNKMVI